MLATPIDAQHQPSARKADLARRNGALSRGPVTAEGKARAARNGTRHGLCAKALVLGADEGAAALAALRAAMLARHQPLDEAEAHWVEELVAVAWRQRRLRALEDAVLARAVAGGGAEADPALPSLATVIRCRGRLERDWRRAAEELAALRRGRGDRLPDSARLRRLARQVELARALAAACPPASAPMAAADTDGRRWRTARTKPRLARTDRPRRTARAETGSARANPPHRMARTIPWSARTNRGVPSRRCLPTGPRPSRPRPPGR